MASMVATGTSTKLSAALGAIRLCRPALAISAANRRVSITISVLMSRSLSFSSPPTSTSADSTITAMVFPGRERKT